MDLIESKALDGLATYTFNSALIADYKSLLVIGEVRSQTAAVTDFMFCRANGDSGGNYNFERQISDGTASSSTNSLAQAGWLFDIIGATGQANEATAVEILVPRHRGAFNKKALWQTGLRKGTLATDYEFYDVFGQWNNTAIITSLTFSTNSAANFTNGSALDLYGLA